MKQQGRSNPDLRRRTVAVFGEVLYDCFPDGQRVLGGAPFNVAWHLHCLGDRPCFISRVGDDELGQRILLRMREHGMDTSNVQLDDEHPTGQVIVSFEGDEPSYDIRPDSAFDFIEAEPLSGTDGGLLYHGTLGLRNDAARAAFHAILRHRPDLALFIDVNLRDPWWNAGNVRRLLDQASWCKLNHHELRRLGYQADDARQAMRELQTAHGLRQVILTRGEAGALVFDGETYYNLGPTPPEHFVDTVGAGDAFSAVYIHGLLAGWTVPETLRQAQDFASRIIGIRGATPDHPDFYTQLGNTASSDGQGASE